MLGQNMNLYREVWNQLREAGLLEIPRVHIHATCGPDTDTLQSAVRKLQGDVVDERTSFSLPALLTNLVERRRSMFAQCGKKSSRL
jgi:hypothetical protein